MNDRIFHGARVTWKGHKDKGPGHVICAARPMFPDYWIVKFDVPLEPAERSDDGVLLKSAKWVESIAENELSIYKDK